MDKKEDHQKNRITPSQRKLRQKLQAKAHNSRSSASVLQRADWKRLEFSSPMCPQISGMAFVVIQHLDPTHKGMLVELLQRGTQMKVYQVKDRTRVEPDSVYVIPPNKDMSILRGIFTSRAVAPRGLRLPIDFFFRVWLTTSRNAALASSFPVWVRTAPSACEPSRKKQAWSLCRNRAPPNLTACRAAPLMPGLADVTAPVEDLPGKIIAYLQHVPLMTKPGLM